MTASSAKSKSEILTFPNNAPQLDLSDDLPRIQSIQALKSVGPVHIPENLQEQLEISQRTHNISMPSQWQSAAQTSE